MQTSRSPVIAALCILRNQETILGPVTVKMAGTDNAQVHTGEANSSGIIVLQFESMLLHFNKSDIKSNILKTNILNATITVTIRPGYFSLVAD